MKILLICLTSFCVLSVSATDKATVSWQTYTKGIPADAEKKASGGIAKRPQIIYWNGVAIGSDDKGFMALKDKIENFRGKVIIYEYLDRGSNSDFNANDPLVSSGKLNKLSPILLRKKILFQIQYKRSLLSKNY